MDKNNKNTDKPNVPVDEIQAQISMLMGLPPEEAEPTMTKFDRPNVQRRNNTSSVSESSNQPKDEESEDLSHNPDSTMIDSIATDEAVVDIIKRDSDTILEDEDKKASDFEIEPDEPKGIKKLFGLWWNNKLARNLTLITVFSIFILGLMFPTTRYATLNAIGVRSEMSFTVADKISGRPVKNVEVKVAETTGKTSEDGSIKLTNLKLGSTDLHLKKRSFEETVIPVTIGWGSNPFESPFEVIPTGTTFKFTIFDWLDNQSLNEAEITDGESVGVSNEEGVANITIEPTDDDLDITISAKGYRSEVVTIPANSAEPQTVRLVADTKDVFISKRSGKYDLYVRDIDGNNEELILPASGSEQSDIHVLNKPDNNNIVALVSSRDGIRNDEGFILSDVYIVDVNDKTANKVEGTQSERIRLIGWSGDSVVFVKTIAGPSASVGNRQRVISYDLQNQETKELASANYFNDVRMISGKVYYIVSSGSSGSQSKGLGVVDVNGDDRRVLIGNDTWSVYRTGNEELVANTAGNKWYKVNLEDNKILLLEGSPPQIQDIKYASSPSGNSVARIEQRDGKPALLITDNSAEESIEKEILRQSGVTYPLRWVNEKTIMFIVNNSDETASYVMSVSQDKPIKIGDMTASVYDQSFFY